MLAVRREAADEQPQIVDNAPVPSPDNGEVLVKMQAASLCGSDIGLLKGEEMSAAEGGLIHGHEGAGVVSDISPGVDDLTPGDSVVVHYPTTCDLCRHCLAGNDNRCRNRMSVGTHRDGTFAEYVAIPARSAVPIADNVPYAWGSIAGCAVSTAYHAVNRAALDPGDTIVVFGAGGVGLHAIMWAASRGAEVIAADVASSKLPLAAEFGADAVVDVTEESIEDIVHEMTNGWGAQATIECSGATEAMQSAINVVNGANRYESGRIVSVGLQSDPLCAEYWELREGAMMVSGDHTRNELAQIVRQLESGELDLSKSITHRRPLTEIWDAVDLLESDEPVGRIVLDIPNE